MDPSLLSQIKKLDYKDKHQIYQNLFSTGYLSLKLNDKLILISLIALAHQKLKVKSPDLTIFTFLIKLTNTSEENTSFRAFLEALSFLVEDLTYGTKVFDSCGLKTSQEIITKIKELLAQWLPF